MVTHGNKEHIREYWNRNSSTYKPNQTKPKKMYFIEYILYAHTFHAEYVGEAQSYWSILRVRMHRAAICLISHLKSINSLYSGNNTVSARKCFWINCISLRMCCIIQFLPYGTSGTYAIDCMALPLKPFETTTTFSSRPSRNNPAHIYCFYSNGRYICGRNCVIVTHQQLYRVKSLPYTISMYTLSSAGGCIRYGKTPANFFGRQAKNIQQTNT